MPKTPTYTLTEPERAALHAWATSLPFEWPIPDGIGGLAEVLGVKRQTLSPFLNGGVLGVPVWRRLIAYMACYHPMALGALNGAASRDTARLIAEIQGALLSRALDAPRVPDAVVASFGLTPPGTIRAGVPE